MFPVERQASLATLPQQSEATREQSSEWSEPLFWLGLGAFPEYQRCFNAGPRKKRTDGWPLRGARPAAFSVPNGGSGRVGALQPKLHDDQRAQTVTGLAGPACVSRIRCKHPAGPTRADAGSAVSLREVLGFSDVRHGGEPVKLRLIWRPVFFRVIVSCFSQRQVLLQTV